MSTTFRTTRSMTKGPACRETLETAELLEQILLHLPAHTISSRAKPVSKSWRNAINASPLIQKKLWLRPQGTHVSSPVRITDNGDNWPLRRGWSGSRALSSGVAFYSGSYQINRLFSEVFKIQFHNKGPLRSMQIAPRITNLRSGDLVQVHFPRHQQSSETDERSSWRDMYLTEPPITTALIEVFARHNHRLPRSARDTGLPGLQPVQAFVRDDQGLKFGLVRDMVDRMMALAAYEDFSHTAAARVCFMVDQATLSI